MPHQRKGLAAGGALILVLAGVWMWWQLPSIVAGAVLHPARTAVYRALPEGCVERSFPGHGITLRGWMCSPAGPRRASLVYLHGIADNRASGAGLISRFLRHGFEVVAYDSRAQGQSNGTVCTYGALEKIDLQSVIAALEPGPVVLLGTSLGGAVALQAAVGEPRITAIVAAEVFSDLPAIIRHRVPLLPKPLLRKAVRMAGVQGGFDAESISPLAAATELHIPVLLIHCADDHDTPPDHSRRVLAALRGPKRLIEVEGAGHNRSLGGDAVWRQIEEWLETVIAAADRQPTQERNVPRS
jgi:pimeloyl-ACP methyl ester carboxylesterase